MQMKKINSVPNVCKGTAAKKLHIAFNEPMLQKCGNIDEDKREELLYKTPSCSKEFDFNENIWPMCCSDFCCYTKRENYAFHFKCLHCGKKIVWEDFT